VLADTAATDMQLILLGTQGGPNFKLDSGETASLILIEGQPYLIDCGYGTMRSLTAAGVSFLDIARVFLTHLHDDHTADLVTLLGHQWTQGRVKPTLVQGPYGTSAMVEAALLYNRANTEIRMLDEARTIRPEDLFSGEDISATQQPLKVYEDSHLRVYSIENTHFPAGATEKMPYRALSYRFENDSRSIVFSGDTSYSPNLVNLAKKADVFVCETMHVARTRAAFERMVANGLYADNAEGIWKHIADTHTSTENAGRMAQEAEVKLLVLNHIIPGALEELPDELYLEGVRKHFQGEVVVGRDLMKIEM